jgi:hypothetical protein
MSLCLRFRWFLPIVSKTVPMVAIYGGYIPLNATVRNRIPRASNEDLPIRYTST